jgi:hypothetical protein
MTACTRYRGDGGDCTGCQQPIGPHIELWRSLAAFHDREGQKAADKVIGLEMVKEGGA